MLNISEEAKEQLKAITDEKGVNYVRVYLDGFGWGGPKFNLSLEETNEENDEVLEEDGFSVLYSSTLISHLKGLKIDYSPGKQGGFIVKSQGAADC